MTIKACLKCGSKNLDLMQVNDGLNAIPAYHGNISWQRICRDCDCRGTPIEFDSEEDYQKFLEGLKLEKADS